MEVAIGTAVCVVSNSGLNDNILILHCFAMFASNQHIQAHYATSDTSATEMSVPRHSCKCTPENNFKVVQVSG